MNYEPLTQEEYLNLERELGLIRSHLPEDKMGYIWGVCNKIRGRKENQPCSCKSAAGLWGSCITDLRTYLKKV